MPDPGKYYRILFADIVSDCLTIPPSLNTLNTFDILVAQSDPVDGQAILYPTYI